MKILSIIFFSLFITQAHAQNDLNQAAGNWGGTLEVPGGGSFKIIFHISNDGEKLTATMDSPDQGAYGMKIDKAEFKENELTLTMNQIQGNYKGTLKEEKFEGTWSQSGQSFTLNLERIVRQGKS